MSQGSSNILTVTKLLFKDIDVLKVEVFGSHRVLFELLFRLSVVTTGSRGLFYVSHSKLAEYGGPERAGGSVSYLLAATINQAGT